MKFTPNKTPMEIMKEGAFGGTYFRDLYSDINELMRSGTKTHGKNLFI